MLAVGLGSKQHRFGQGASTRALSEMRPRVTARGWPNAEGDRPPGSGKEPSSILAQHNIQNQVCPQSLTVHMMKTLYQSISIVTRGLTSSRC